MLDRGTTMRVGDVPIPIPEVDMGHRVFDIPKCGNNPGPAKLAMSLLSNHKPNPRHVTFYADTGSLTVAISKMHSEGGPDGFAFEGTLVDTTISHVATGVKLIGFYDGADKRGKITLL